MQYRPPAQAGKSTKSGKRADCHLTPLDATARHRPQPWVGVALAGVGKRGEDVGPTECDPSERVDGSSSHVGVSVAQELQRAWHEEIVGRPALVLLARVTGECVECPRS